jgi:hypothetical protein
LVGLVPEHTQTGDLGYRSVHFGLLITWRDSHQQEQARPDRRYLIPADGNARFQNSLQNNFHSRNCASQ